MIRLRLLAFRLAPLLPLLLVAGEAAARVGGGEGYGRPSGGGGSHVGSGGSSSGDGLGDLIFLVLWLCVEFPAIGIPLLILLVAGVVLRFVFAGTTRRTAVRTTTRSGATSRAPMRRRSADLSALQASDPGFSLTVLLDFLVLVHRRAWDAATTGAWEPLAPYVAPSAQASVVPSEDWKILDVIPGAVRPLRAEVAGSYVHLHVRFESTRLERSPQGREQRFLVEEEWTFRRKVGVATPEPEKVMRLGCPSCGNALEATKAGACPTCAAAIGAGEHSWQAHVIRVLSRIPAEAPPVSIWTGGEELGATLPSVADPGLSAAHRALHARHPDFDDTAFQARVATIFQGLQLAWSEGRWQDARPWVTDPLFQTLRFQVERYTENGLRNKLEDVQLTRSVTVKVATDAWYESIVVRLWGSAKDSVVNVETGKVVGGNPRLDRKFSEYWTFVRAAGTGGATSDPARCPSCGAPADNVNAAGICGYCESKITTGRFDWVLSRIEQPEAYEG
jgi:hypothetical protein